jgi:uncharacterized RDD family membrane protein YckC
MAERSHIPDELRARIQKQRKRQRLVRFSFAITIAVTVILLFGIQQAQMLAPTARSLILRPTADSLWLIDQHYDLSSQTGRDGSFALVRIKEGEATQGTRYDGLVNAITHTSDGKLGITTGPRYLEFDLTKEGWPRSRIENLALGDPSSSAAVLHAGGTTWVCWTSGKQVMVRPLDAPDAQPHSVHSISDAGATLGGVAVQDRIWLSVSDKRADKLTLVGFRPGVTKPAASQEPAAAAVADPAGTRKVAQTSVEVIARVEIGQNIRRAGLAVLPGARGDTPVVSYMRKNEKTWNIAVYDPVKKEVVDGPVPPRDAPPAKMELNNFLSLGLDGNQVAAVFDDDKTIMLAHGTIGENGLEWGTPEALPIDRTQGLAPYIIWLVILCGVLLLMASLGVWLLLNRERPSDRTLAAMLERKLDEDTKKIAKPEPKLPYASGLQRILALFIDIALTSPIVILLQDVYEYTWEQAYGFLAFGSVAQLDGALAQTVLATVVTLLVLVIYSAIGELFWGKTFGKALLRIRVVDRKGEHPAAWRVIVRNLLKVFELIHFLILLIPMVLMMVTGKQQRLGDLAAGTFVIIDAVADEATDDLDM